MSLGRPYDLSAARAARRLVARDDGKLCIGSATIPKAALIGGAAGAAGLVLVLVIACCLCGRRDSERDLFHQHWLQSLRRRRKTTSEDDDEDETASSGKPAQPETYPDVNYAGAYAPMIGAQQAAISAVMAAAATGQPAAAASAPASYNSNTQAAASATRSLPYSRPPQSVDPSASGFSRPGPGSRPGVSFADMSQSGVSARFRGAGGSKFTARSGQSRGGNTIAPTVVDSNAGSSWHGGASTQPGSRAPGSAAAWARSEGGSSYKGPSNVPYSDVDINSAYAKSHGTSAA